MLSKFKTLPVLAAMAGGVLAAGALAPSPSLAADCFTVPISALYETNAEFICGDKRYYEFTSTDFDIPGVALFSQSADATVNTLAFTEFSSGGLGVGTYTINFLVDVLSSKTIVGYSSSVTASGSSFADQFLLTDTPPPYPFTGILEINDGTTVSNWNLTITQTPGPLPILGAGAAFGISRKLRRRIKSVA